MATNSLVFDVPDKIIVSQSFLEGFALAYLLSGVFLAVMELKHTEDYDEELGVTMIILFLFALAWPWLSFTGLITRGNLEFEEGGDDDSDS